MVVLWWLTPCAYVLCEELFLYGELRLIAVQGPFLIQWLSCSEASRFLNETQSLGGAAEWVEMGGVQSWKVRIHLWNTPLSPRGHPLKITFPLVCDHGPLQPPVPTTEQEQQHWGLYLISSHEHYIFKFLLLWRFLLVLTLSNSENEPSLRSSFLPPSQC